MSLYQKGETRADDGVELSPGRDQVLTLVGRDGEGKRTFVMILTTEKIPGTDSIRIASVEMLKENEARNSRAIVAIVSSG
jgi:ATPase subunit of ABC transporter with duplicated ATPase domains